MKIVALTDIHGAYERAVTILEKELPDLVILGGDLTTVGSVKEAEEAIRRIRDHASTLLCVAGNMDLPQHDMLFERLDLSLNGHGRIVSDIGFFGVSGGPISPLRTPYELHEDEIAKRIRRGYKEVERAARKIFVPHAPPYGSKVDIIHSGYHVGSTAVRDFIEDAQPDVVICGHIHEARGQDHIEKTKIVNCGEASKGYYCVVSISDTITIENRKL